jgi:hypothetical protein
MVIISIILSVISEPEEDTEEMHIEDAYMWFGKASRIDVFNIMVRDSIQR